MVSEEDSTIIMKQEANAAANISKTIKKINKEKIMEDSVREPIDHNSKLMVIEMATPKL